MGKNKLHHYNEVANFENVIQVKPHEKPDFNLKGNWCKNYFKNNNPIVLELACGKGEYTLGLANLFENKNFIGVDVKGARIWRGAKTALEQNMNHVAFLRIMIEWLPFCFAENEIDEIWITFADPYLSTSKEHKRLTSPKFLEMYAQLLKPNGTINLKTDDNTLYQFTLDVINGIPTHKQYEYEASKHYKLLQADDDIYKNGTSDNQLLNIRTYYEGKHLLKNKKIKYVQILKQD